MANFDLTKPVVVNGETYQPNDLTQTTLFVHGVEPTNYEQYVYCNILAQHKNIKSTPNGDRAGGNAQAQYKYPELADLNKFHEHKYPYYLPVVTAKTVNKKGDMVDMVLFVDFANIVEVDLVPRQVTKSSATPAPAKA